MASNQSFNGAIIYDPGAYSHQDIDLGGSFPLGVRGIVGIFGESSTGKPGALEDIEKNFYTPEELPSIISKYGDGNISDIASFLFAPSNDGAIPNGAQYVYIYKTNASTNASKVVDKKSSNYANYVNFVSKLFGVAGDAITITWATGAHPSPVVVTVVGTDITITADNGVATPAQVVAAVNIHPQASLLVTASEQYSPSINPWFIDTAYPVLTLAGGNSSVATLYSATYGLPSNFLTVTNTITNETVAKVTATAPIDLTAHVYLPGDKFTLQLNGSEVYTFTFPVGCNVALDPAEINSIVTLLIALSTPANWSSPSGGTPINAAFTINVTGTDAAAVLEIKQDATFMGHRKGYGKTMELKDGVGTPLAHSRLNPGFLIPSEEVDTITIKNLSTRSQFSDIVGGDIAISFRYSDLTAQSAQVQVTSTSVILTVVGGYTPGTYTFLKSQYKTLTDLASAVNLLSNWSATFVNPADKFLQTSTLDIVSGLGAISATNYPCRIKKDAYSVKQFYAQYAAIVYMTQTTYVTGLLDDQAELSFTGGTVGETTNASITAALNEMTKVRINAVLPLFSRDATADFADGLTDTASNYTIAGIHAALQNHLALMRTTTRRSERQGYASLKDTFDNCKIVASDLTSGLIQLCIQDIKQISAFGELKWFQPFAQAAFLAGGRMGSPVGTPMTFKFFNISGLRQTAQAMTTDEEDIINDFDPRTQSTEAIIAGITFMEKPETGGYRFKLDNTTYGKDGNWVWNRGNVVYAADIFAYDFRDKLEKIYVGRKNTVRASEVKSTCMSILGTYLNEGITVSTADAAGGFKDLTVKIVGNTIYISVTVKLVEGIDFIFIEELIQRAVQSA